MIILKNKEQITAIKEGGKILARILEAVLKEVRPGVTTGYLNQIARNLILEKGGTPSFEGYNTGCGEIAFPTCLCTSINEQVVHAPARFDIFLQSGDILSIDVGMKYKGCYTDMAKTVGVGKISKDAKKLIKVTKQCLDLAIKQIKPGKTIFDLGQTIETYAKLKGFSVVRDLVGHGVGCAVHEDPQIPNFAAAGMEKIIIKEGMVLALEPMLVEGSYKIKTLDDGWTVVTRDGKLSAHFEHTVIVTKKGSEIATI